MEFIGIIQLNKMSKFEFIQHYHFINKYIKLAIGLIISNFNDPNSQFFKIL